MDYNIFVQGLGLLGSFLIAGSMIMRKIKPLRFVNLLGSLVFGVYGILIGSLSVTLLNLFTVGVNIYFLVIYQARHGQPGNFDILFKDPMTDEYIRRFINFRSRNIKRYFPSFDPDPETGTLVGTECCFILRETIPVSLVAFRREKSGEIAIELDYAIPAYRDYKNGKFFYETAAAQIAEPGAVFSAIAEVPSHAAYLKKLGFTEVHRDELGTHFRKEYKG